MMRVIYDLRPRVTSINAQKLQPGTRPFSAHELSATDSTAR